ncbi:MULTISPECIES: hypothetical protein [Pseudomonas]|uniref:Uncharacterized protein n=1 Tax=Pseudomonas izuensis TaxID=2684212 RepID=A0ABM7RVG9_9PSED|nr:MULTISPECIES: hypothetical protein [Pseudomonas]RKS12614.1 hypothetical protein BJ917_5853 [Pseudomonas sp. WPR_5_2]BCX69655.1 hypothetical protein LAB08_R43070 [Pseudomonas izuensis]
MQHHDLKLPGIPGVTLAEKRPRQQAAKPTGEVDMEPRVIELERHLNNMRREMEEVRSDVKSIKHRLAYSAGGTVVVLGLLGWVANSRFDQLVTLLLAH